MNLTNDAKKLIRLFLDNGYRAYAVGGCVRDKVLKRRGGDIDITTSAKPDEMERLLEANGIRYIETGLKHGTITALINKVPYEITTFRSDGEYLDNRHPEQVEFVSDIRLDLARRDFTMNALAYNDDEGFIDAYGGLADIQKGIIRAVGDPDRRFQEDGLRIMRALRFASVLGFTIEENTKRAIFENKELLKNIAAERLYTEFVKLLLGENVEQILLEYKEVIAVFIPEIAPCFDCGQRSKWHLYDVYTHIVKSVAIAPKKDYIRLALFFHDIAKPACKTTDIKGYDHFFYHPERGAEMVQDILYRLKVSNEMRRKVVTLVEIHDKHITRRPTNIKKWLRLLGEDLTYNFIDVKIADLLTHNLELAGHEVDELRRVKSVLNEILANHEPYRISDLAINGNDLIKIGFTGSEIQEELERLVNLVSGDARVNKREKLLKAAERDFNEIS